MDIEALQNLGYQASGWDPAFRLNAPKSRAAVVNLGFVLNVIEEPSERIATLRDAYSLAERVLLVSTMVRGQETDAHSRPYRFISYSHIDNEPQSPEQKGWVTRFHSSLGAFVSMRLGEKAEIWRDDKLGGSDIFAKEILDQFPRTALLLSVVTPRYVRSEWCTREVNAFCEAARLTGGIVVDNKARATSILVKW